MDARHFRLLCAAAAADGQLQQEEKTVLLRYGKALGIDADGVTQILGEVSIGRGLAIDAPETQDECDQLLRELCDVVAADGIVGGDERDFVHRLAKPLGSTRKMVEGELDDALKRRHEVVSKMDTTPPPDMVLHSAENTALATLVGGPIAGSVMIALNYLARGDRASAAKIALAGVFGGFWIGFLIEVARLRTAIFAALLMVPIFFAVAKVLHGKAYDEHVAARGRCGNWIQATGVGLVVLAAVLVVILGTGLLDDLGEPVLVAHGTVYYRAPASEDEARKVGRVLDEAGLFGNDGDATVQVIRRQGVLVVRIVVKEGAWDRSDVVEGFREIRRHVANDITHIAVAVDLCDDDMETKKTIGP